MPNRRGQGRETFESNSDSMEEIKRSLNFMSEELTKLSKQQEQLIGLMEEVKLLKVLLSDRDKRIAELEQKVDDLEQYTRRDDLVITGLDVKHRSYARVAANINTTEDSPHEELLTLEQQVVTFLQDKNIDIKHEDISICHTLPTRSDKLKSSIVIRFISRKSRNNLIMQARKLKGTNVYINEHLTKKNGTIAREARLLKKHKKIAATWTRNGNIWIKIKEGTQARMVKELKDLEIFK